MGQRQMNTERVQVAATLRRMRQEAGLTRDQAAKVLSCTASKIGDLETGRSGAKPVELAALLDRYGITGSTPANSSTAFCEPRAMPKPCCAGTTYNRRRCWWNVAPC